MNGRVGNAVMRRQSTAIILPDRHVFTNLVIKDAHEEVLHGGIQITMRKLRDDFSIIHARSRVKYLTRRCLVCYRYRMRPLSQQMGRLPLFRTEQARSFAFVGCDFTGHYHLKTSRARNAPTAKGYIALFICLTTKAIHLEVVEGLTTAEFLMAFDNFIARRGIPIALYSDNGTNLTGGAKEIQKLHKQMLSQDNPFTRALAAKNIQFKNIPAKASHMAGIFPSCSVM